MAGHKRNTDYGNLGRRPKEDNDDINRRKLYVGKIPLGTVEGDIREAFQNFAVEKVYLRPFTSSIGFAFVVLDTVEAASRAEQEVNGISVNGSKIVVRPATVRSGAPPASPPPSTDGSWDEPMPVGGDRGSGVGSKERELFVGNLNSNVEEQDLIELFEPFGIEKVVLKKSDKKRPYAFVTMKEKSGMMAALERLKNAHVRGGKISLSLCKAKASNAATENCLNGSPVLGETASSDASSTVEVYVGNLPDDATEGDIRELFSDFTVGYVQIKAKGGRTFSFVGIKGAPSTENICSVSNIKRVKGKKVVIRPSNPSGGGETPAGSGRGGISCAQKGGGDSWDSHPATASSSGDKAVASWGDRMQAMDGHGGPRVTAASPRTSAMNDGPPPLEPIEDDPVIENGTGQFCSEQADGDTPTKELFVDNLRRGISKEEVASMFRKFGVANVILKNSPKKTTSFVTLYNEDQVQEAINEMNGKTGSDGRPITVRRKFPRPPGKGGVPQGVSLNDVPPLLPIVDNQEVFVANLPAEVGEEDLTRLFEKYGANEIHLTSTGAHPEAHVILSSAENARKAVQDLNGASMCGKKLRLELVAEQYSNGSSCQPALLGAARRPVVLCIANFPFSSREHHLMELLENFSPQDILIMKPSDGQEFTRAYVSVPSWEHAEDAELEMNNTFFFGRLIAVVPMGEGTVQEIASACEPNLSKGNPSGASGPSPGAKWKRSRVRPKRNIDGRSTPTSDESTSRTHR